MKRITIIVFSFLIISCSNYNQKQEDGQSMKFDSLKVESFNSEEEIPAETEDKLFEIISLLPEFQESSKYIDSLTNHTKGISLMFDKSIDKVSEFYITVGFNGEIRFETYYRFLIDTTDWKVKIKDVFAGDYVPVEIWRARQINR